MNQIYLYSVAEAKNHLEATEGWHVQRRSRASADDGKYLFFTSERDFNPIYSATLSGTTPTATCRGVYAACRSPRTRPRPFRRALTRSRSPARRSLKPPAPRPRLRPLPLAPPPPQAPSPRRTKPKERRRRQGSTSTASQGAHPPPCRSSPGNYRQPPHSVGSTRSITSVPPVSMTPRPRASPEAHLARSTCRPWRTKQGDRAGQRRRLRPVGRRQEA